MKKATWKKKFKFGKALMALLLAAVLINYHSLPIFAQKENLNVGQNGPVQLGTDSSTEEEYLMSFGKVSENRDAILYADMKNGHIALQNKVTGRIWYSVPNDFMNDRITFGDKRSDIFSELIVKYLRTDEESSAIDVSSVNSHNDCVFAGSVSVSAIEGGIYAEYEFTSINTIVPVRYVLTEKGFEATVELNKIKCPNDIIVVSISLLPSFGAGNWEDNGYIFVPDGCGALIAFNNNYEDSSGYHSLVYGQELSTEQKIKKSVTQNVHMPVFGIRNNGEGLVGIIVSGDSMASINAQNGNSETGYNSVWSQAEIRIISNTTLYENDWANKSVLTKASRILPQLNDYTVRYVMLSPENSDYVGMASVYRDYLINEKGLKRQEITSSLALTLYGAADVVGYFIGIPYTKILPLTTFEEGEKIVKELRESGIDSLSVQYAGWSNSGILNLKLPKNLNPIGKLGGKSGLSKFKEYLKENNYDIYFDFDFIRYRRSGNGYSKSSDSAKTVFGNSAKQYSYLRSVYSQDTSAGEYRLLAVSELSGISQKLLGKADILRSADISLSTLGQYVYSDFNEKKGLYRTETVKEYEEILSEYSQVGFNCAFNNANAYVFPYAKQIFSAPMTSSEYTMFDRDVPFYQIVLRGYVNISSVSLSSATDKRAVFLKAIETGSNLYFDGMAEDASLLSSSRYDYLYSTTFDLWQDTAVDYYKEINPLLKKLGNGIIVAHSVYGDIAKTVYDNGIIVYVNYGSGDAELDGITVKGLSYAVIE